MMAEAVTVQTMESRLLIQILHIGPNEQPLIHVLYKWSVQSSSWRIFKTRVPLQCCVLTSGLMKH